MKKDISVRVIRDFGSLKTIEKQWDDLLHGCEDKSPFLSFAWISKWWEVFGENRQLFIILIYFDNQLSGIFPLMISIDTIGFVPVRMMQFIGVRKSDYMGPLLPEYPEICWQKGLDTVYDNRNLWDIAELGRVRDNTEIFYALKKVLTAWKKINYIVRADKDCLSSPAITVKESWDEYSKHHISSKFSYVTKRRFQKLEQQGVVLISRIEDKEGLRDVFKDLEELENNSWKGVEGRGMFSNEQNRDFFFRVFTEFAEAGWLSIHTLRVNEQLISYSIDLKFEGRYYFYSTSYDSDWKNYAPGMQLMIRILRGCFEGKIDVIDFLQGEEEYKLKFANTINHVNKILLFHNGLPSFPLYYIEKYLRPVATTFKNKIIRKKKRMNKDKDKE